MAGSIIVPFLFGVLKFAASAVLAVVSIFFGVRVFDRLTEGIDEMRELAKGNAAVAIMMGAIIISIALLLKPAIFEFAHGIRPGYGADLLLGLAAINIVKMAIGLLVAIITIFLSFRVLDMLTADIDEVKELKKGNVGIAIMIAAVILAVTILVSGGLGSITGLPTLDSCVIANELQGMGMPFDADACIPMAQNGLWN
jgi:uncharacterized membrane protein YjfL (UPF0719 family)